MHALHRTAKWRQTIFLSLVLHSALSLNGRKDRSGTRAIVMSLRITLAVPYVAFGSLWSTVPSQRSFPQFPFHDQCIPIATMNPPPSSDLILWWARTIIVRINQNLVTFKSRSSLKISVAWTATSLQLLTTIQLSSSPPNDFKIMSIAALYSIQ